MMYIEIAEPGRMTQSGSSLLRLIQNNSMPILDLLVRESVQNSLDAAKSDGDYVSVDFITGTFISKELSKELDDITDGLNKRFRDKEYKFIAIADSNTVGLTGKLHHDEVTENDYGNLLKLVYDISKPQDAEGAGGSWGLGKTVYFRVGIGLVIYYSRIINDKGHYESRLAASFVEDELGKDSIIPRRNGKSKSGIAWWGEKIGSNKTIPIRNEKYIKKILDIFHIEPYKDDKTGTIIIIPYIDSEKLLSHNQAEYLDNTGKPIIPYWCTNLDDYLSIALQRWYAPRLNNINYPHGKWLRARINGRCITYNSMEPVFQVIQGLYNRAANKKAEFNDILHNHTVKLVPVQTRKVLQSSEAGFVAFTKADRDILKMNPPYNKHNPFMYLNIGFTYPDKNRPIITFSRKPGLLVSYETTGPWADKIEETNKNEFIIATFVLNSGNKLSDIDISLEEYIRRGEMADHNSWNDYTLRSTNPRIVSRIQQLVNNKIANEFSCENDTEIGIRLSSGLGKLFGDLLLPPVNFGMKPSGPSPKESNKHRKITVENHKGITLSLAEDKIKYNKTGIEIPINIKTKKEIYKVAVTIGIEAESGIISAKEWENELEMNLPFDIEEVAISFISFDNKEVITYPKVISVSKTLPQSEFAGMSISVMKSDKGCYYGFMLSSEQKHNFDAELLIKLNLLKRDIRTVLNVEADEGDK